MKSVLLVFSILVLPISAWSGPSDLQHNGGDTTAGESMDEVTVTGSRDSGGGGGGGYYRDTGGAGNSSGGGGGGAGGASSKRPPEITSPKLEEVKVVATRPMPKLHPVPFGPKFGAILEAGAHAINNAVEVAVRNPKTVAQRVGTFALTKVAPKMATVALHLAAANPILGPALIAWDAYQVAQTIYDNSPYLQNKLGGIFRSLHM